MNEIEAFIRQEAIKRGINPDVPVNLARHEGGLKNPFRHGEGPAPKSQSAAFGDREHSFGPFQLYISGNNAGLGDRALAAGVDPRKDWKAGVQFALDEAARVGWGQWYGRKPAGIGIWDGIKNSKPMGVTLTAGPKYTAPIGPTPGGEPLPSAVIPQTAVAEAEAAPPPATIGESVKQDIMNPEGILAGLASSAANRRAADAEVYAAFSQVPTGTLDTGNQAQFAAAQQLMASLLQKRRSRVPGVSLSGGMV